MFRAFLQKREQEKKRKEHERLSDAEFIELLRRSPSGFKPDDLIARLGLRSAQQLLNAEWDQAKTRTALPGWRQLLKRLAVTFALRADCNDFLRAFFAVEPDATDARAIRLACLRLATVPPYDRDPVLILVGDPGEPPLSQGYPLPVKFVSREQYAQVEATYRDQERLTDWWQPDLCPAAQAIQYDGQQATLRFLWDGLGNGERYTLRRLEPALWGVVDYGELFVELA